MSWEITPSGTMTVATTEEAVFKKPKPPKRKVLDEDAYLAEVEKIIVRSVIILHPCCGNIVASCSVLTVSYHSSSMLLRARS